MEERTGFYFYTDEQSAVVEYIATDSAKRKNELYETVLKSAFTRMIECIIRRYFKDNISQSEFNDIFNDSMSHVIDKMVSFSEKRGAKAYSYLGTIIKNYVLSVLIKNRKKTLTDARYDDVSEEITNNPNYSYDVIYTKQADMTEIIVETKVKINNKIINDNSKLNRNEMLVGKAIVDLMENWDELFNISGNNKFDRSSVLLYFKETTNLSSKDIRNAMKKYKKIYHSTKENIL